MIFGYYCFDGTQTLVDGNKVSKIRFVVVAVEMVVRMMNISIILPDIQCEPRYSMLVYCSPRVFLSHSLSQFLRYSPTSVYIASIVVVDTFLYV